MYLRNDKRVRSLYISRDLTETEKRNPLAVAGQNGDSQMIMVRHHGQDPSRKHLREIDMVCGIGEKLYIVKAKNTRKGDQHQLPNNAALAEQFGWGAMYALTNTKSAGGESLCAR